MLPFLIGGLALGVGKMIYDAVTDDSGSSTSTSTSPKSSKQDIKAARAKVVMQQRKSMTKELLESTAVEVANLLAMHKDLIRGQAKISKLAQPISGVLSQQARWPYPTTGGVGQPAVAMTQSKDDTQIRVSVLSEDDLRKAANSASKASGLDILTPLTDNLSYKDFHAKEQLKIKRLVTKHDALIELIESL